MAVSAISQHLANAVPDHSPFLQLPSELRNSIYQYAVVETDIITVDAHGFRTPELLRTCKQVRREAGRIFYMENTFNIALSTYDISIFCKWEKRVRSVLGRGEDSRHTMSRAITRGQPSPHWSNLVEWMRRFHRRATIRRALKPSRMDVANAELMAIGMMFETIKSLRGRPWSEVEELLRRFRVMLVAMDGRWDQ